MQVVYLFKGPRRERVIDALAHNARDKSMTTQSVSNVSINRSIKCLTDSFPILAGDPSSYVISRSDLPHAGGHSIPSTNNTPSNFLLNFKPLVRYLSFYAIRPTHEQLQHSPSIRSNSSSEVSRSFKSLSFSPCVPSSYIIQVCSSDFGTPFCSIPSSVCPKGVRLFAHTSM